MSAENTLYLIATSKMYNPGTAVELVQVKTGAGYVMSLEALNVNAATRYLYLFDNTASTGALLIAPVKLTAGQSWQLSFPTPLTFTTGLRANISSGAAGVFTTSGANDLILTAQYF